MDYSNIRSMARAGIDFFSDENGTFEIVLSGGGVEIDSMGNEVSIPERRGNLSGLVRDVKQFDIDGSNIIAGDKRGIFGSEVPIELGMIIYVDGDAYRVVNPRAIKPTGTVVAYRPILRRVAVAHG